MADGETSLGDLDLIFIRVSTTMPAVNDINHFLTTDSSYS